MQYAQLPEIAQPPSLPLPDTGEPAIALRDATFTWKATSEGEQPTVQDVTLEVLFTFGAVQQTSRNANRGLSRCASGLLLRASVLRLAAYWPAPELVRGAARKVHFPDGTRSAVPLNGSLATWRMYRRSRPESCS